MNYVLVAVILLGCVIIAVLVVVPMFRLNQMQSSDLHLLKRFNEVAKENREMILDIERRLDHTDAPPKAPGVPDVSPEGETTIRKDRPS